MTPPQLFVNSLKGQKKSCPNDDSSLSLSYHVAGADDVVADVDVDVEVDGEVDGNGDDSAMLH